uniref:Acyltransferase C-terminal domain-containing protein n=3 Tax=Ditylum brightwellii TaxID=49249 RepID=A0A7S4QH82_9STRA
MSTVYFNGIHPSNSNGGNGSSPKEQHDRSSPRTTNQSVIEEDDVLVSLMNVFSSLAVLCALAQSVLGLFTLLGLLYLVVRPFSSTVYRRLAASIGASYMIDALSLILPNTRLYLTGDSDIPSPVGTSLLVCNHVWDGDWWSILMLGRCIGLRGTIKAFLRDEVFRNWATDCCHTSSEAPISALHQAQRRDSSGSPQTPPLLSSAALEQNMPPLRRFTYCSIRLLLNRLLEFPLLISPSVSNTGSSFSLSSMNVQDERSERKEEMHALLRDFASSSATAPVHLLLFPEGWSLEGYSTCCCNNHTENPNSEIQSLADRRSVMAKSVEFAKREGRPQLRHLLLPRTKGFNATLQSLRESSPVVYDMTMAYNGYDGSIPISLDLSFQTMWRLLMKRSSSEVHLRIKRFSVEEVLQDVGWLDKQWAEKDRLLGHFARHQQFPLDGRGFCRHREFDTRTHSIEGSIFSLGLLMWMPCAIPFLLLVSIPLFWLLLWAWLAYRTFGLIFPDWVDWVEGTSSSSSSVLMRRSGGPGVSSRRNADGSEGHSGADSVGGTPFIPVTPFASPLTMTSWGTSDNVHNFQEKKSPRR